MDPHSRAGRPDSWIGPSPPSSNHSLNMTTPQRLRIRRPAPAPAPASAPTTTSTNGPDAAAPAEGAPAAQA
ncbi:hypothetical protein NMY22_g12260 [Coprinellus aureogranulatus]|nr:hypothetical protein NMY22_g12260 [Coprinellus aureogranulatus]